MKSHELQQLGHPNFVWYIFRKSGVWTTHGSEKLEVRKNARFDVNSWVDISQTTTARASKFYLVLRLEFSNIFLKYGVWTTNGKEMLKVRRKAKFDLDSWVDVSQATTTRTSKLCVVLSLELSSIFSKPGVWNTYCLEMLKVTKQAKFNLNSWPDISWTRNLRLRS